MSQAEGTNSFNDANYGDIAGSLANQVNGADSIGVRAGGDATVNRNITGAISGDVSAGARVIGAGGTYVESLDAGTVKGAFDFGTSALATGSALGTAALASAASTSGAALGLVSGLTQDALNANKSALDSALDFGASALGSLASQQAASQSLNASLVSNAQANAAGNLKSAFDFGASTLDKTLGVTREVLSAFAASQTASQKFQSDLVGGFKSLTEGTADTLRGALSATLNAPALAQPVHTEASAKEDTSNRLLYIGAGLAALWILSRLSRR